MLQQPHNDTYNNHMEYSISGVQGKFESGFNSSHPNGKRIFMSTLHINRIAGCKFMQLIIFCKYICVHGLDRFTEAILLRNYQSYFCWKQERLREILPPVTFRQHVFSQKIYSTPRVHLVSIGHHRA